MRTKWVLLVLAVVAVGALLVFVPIPGLGPLVKGMFRRTKLLEREQAERIAATNAAVTALTVASQADAESIAIAKAAAAAAAAKLAKVTEAKKELLDTMKAEGTIDDAEYAARYNARHAK